MTKHQAAQRFALGSGKHHALELVALQAFLHQAGCQQQHAARCVHQGIFKLRVGVEGLVGRDGPCGGGPDHGEGFFASIARQSSQSKSRGQGGVVVGLKGHVQRVAFLVGVFDFEFGQAGAAVKAPIHGLQAAVDKTALDDPLEGTDLARFIGGVHGAVRALPVAQNAQALEVFALLADLLGGVGTALGLHVIPGEVAAMQFFDGVLDRQAVAVPAGDVLRVEPGELLALDNHVLEHFVQGVADVQFAVGIRWAVVQHEQRRALTVLAQSFVEVILVPVLYPRRLAFGQVAPHGKRGIGQVQGAAVINRMSDRFRHGSY